MNTDTTTAPKLKLIAWDDPRLHQQAVPVGEVTTEVLTLAEDLVDLLAHMQDSSTVVTHLSLAEKTCSKCHRVKSLDQFYKMSVAKDGLQSQCKLCQLLQKRERAGIPLDAPIKTRVTDGSRVCSWPGCERPYRCSGYCNMHNLRSHNGTPMDAPYEAHDGGQSCSVPGCERPFVAKGFCGFHWKRNRDGIDLDSPLWGSQEDTGYFGTHQRLRKNLGSASEYKCACGKQAEHWSYSNICPDEKADEVGTYCLHPECYTSLCVSCHHIRDDTYLNLVSAS